MPQKISNQVSQKVYFLWSFLWQFNKVWSQIDLLEKDPSEKSDESKYASEFEIFGKKWAKVALRKKYQKKWGGNFIPFLSKKKLQILWPLFF